MKYPVLLRNESYFTELIVLDSHKQVHHSGTEATLNEIRRNYWIIRGRQIVKSILKRCVICKIIQGKCLVQPQTPPLPSFRVNCSHAYESVGVNYAGPLFCKDIFHVTAEMNKCYILLFTYSVTRAIHLELVTSFSSNCLILALKRFFSRCGTPRLIVSDNFKTFKCADIKSFTLSRNIKWQYILEKSPWWGSFYERLIARQDIFSEITFVICSIANSFD